MSELERNLAAQEKDIRNQTSKLQELQTHLNQARKELAERDRNLAKAGHELSQAADRHQQLEAKVQLVFVFYKLYWKCEKSEETCRRGLKIICAPLVFVGRAEA